MKRVATIALVCVIAVICILLALVSCKTELSGTYDRIGDGVVSYTFDGDKFVQSVNGEAVLEGTYSVYYGHIIFRYEIDGEKKFDYLEYAQTEDINEIQIGEVRFLKQSN